MRENMATNALALTEKQSGFHAYVNVFANDDNTNTDSAAMETAKAETSTDGRLSLSDSVGKDWELVGALSHLAPRSLPELSQLDAKPVVMEEVAGSEIKEGETLLRKSSSAEVTRLCGYLRKYKLGARSLTKVFKRRWFVFADSTCNLLYYRTPQDLIPLGEINISHATFTFDILTERNVNVFEIRVHKKTYWLEADDRQTMLYWLQELQLRRRQFRCRRTNQAAEERMNVREGLIDFGDGCQPGSSPTDQEPGLLDNISPPQNVGRLSAGMGGGRTAIKDLSITNLGVELKNMFSIRRMRSERHVNGHAPQLPCTDSHNVRSSVGPSTQGLSSPPPHNKIKFPGVSDTFQTIKKKFMGKMPSIQDDEGKPCCNKCKHLQDCLKNLQDDALLVLEELTMTRELWKSAQKEIEKLEADREIYRNMADKAPHSDLLKELSLKSDSVIELESVIRDLSERLVQSEIHTRSLEAELHGLREDQTMYQDNIGVKDNIVMALTSRVAELEQALDLQPARHDIATNTTMTRNIDTSELYKVKDKCEAYELQNKLLNQEIMELNQLWQTEEARGDQYQIQMTQVEAQFYELKSKYIYVLQEISKPQLGVPESSNQELVSQLLQDAIESDKRKRISDSGSETSSSKHTFPVDPYDQYGFGLQFTIEGEDLGSVAGNLLQRSQQLKARRLNSDLLHAMKWEKFLISLGERIPQRSKEFKLLLRDGVSPRFRGQIWKICIELTVGGIRSRCGCEYYNNLLERIKSSTTISPIRHQVELDLLRTLPNNKYYECYDSDGIPRLKNILLAYSIHNPSVGYCQGLNRLAAILLLFLDEEDAFWGLVLIIEHLMPVQYYDHTLIAAHTDQRVLKEVLSEKLPHINSHFVALGFDVSLFTFNWFLAIFVDNIPVDTYLRIWDSFLYEGSKVLFRYAVAILKFCEDAILSKKDSADLHAYMRSLGDVLTDVNRISQIAFSTLNPFPMKMVNVKRQVHLQKLKVELQELDKLREQFQNSYSKQQKETEDAVSDITSDDES